MYLFAETKSKSLKRQLNLRGFRPWFKSGTRYFAVHKTSGGFKRHFRAQTRWRAHHLLLESSLPLVGDDGVRVAVRPQVWCGRCYTLVKEQQQGLMTVLLHTRHDGDQGAQGEGGRFSRARKVICRLRDNCI